MESLRGIGRMSRESGLTVSALRFYDGAGLLSPAHVDGQSGYRFYAPEQLADARLVAALRRAGMPLAGIREVLEHRRDPMAVDVLLDDHLQRLEQGLADARRALSAVPSLLTPPESLMSTTVTLLARHLADGLRAVRFAAGADPELPVLGCVLFDVGDGLTLVATDRYRLATAPVSVVAVYGPAVAAVVPAALADRIARVLDGPDQVMITVVDGRITLRADAAEVTGRLSDDVYPDLRRLPWSRWLSEGATAVSCDALRAAVVAAPTRTSMREQDGVEFAVTELAVGPDGQVTIDAGDGIGVNREFLLEALDAGGGGQLLLSLDGPAAPLVLRSERSTSLLMPVRL